jgi:FixJ family two-component response regulator
MMRILMRTTDAIIFIVDDDLSIRKALGRLLKSMGFSVKTFGSGQDFLAHSQPDACDCLILDVRMPDMNGLDLWKQLACSGFTIPTIFMTAYEDIRERKWAMEAGAVEYLQKPLDEKSLVNAIYSALERGKSE